MHKSFFEKVGFGDPYVIRMIPDDDIPRKIVSFCKENGISHAVIVSAIGSAKEVVFRDLLAGVKIPLEPSKTNELRMMGPYEILSLEGNVFPMDNELIVHLHTLLGTENGSVCGGHVMQAKVLSTLELILVEIKKASSYRMKSAITGLNELLMD